VVVARHVRTTVMAFTARHGVAHQVPGEAPDAELHTVVSDGLNPPLFDGEDAVLIGG
jgi:hypothetical protein